MAKDYYKLLEVDTSIDSIRTLKEEIKLLKGELEGLTIDSQEYNEVSDQLYSKQTRLNQVIRDTKRPVEDAEGSFNSWLATLRQLKEEWKATGDAMERAELGVKINEVKAKINEANEGIGNFQHNVGNYKNSIIDAFQQMGISATGILKPLGKLGAGTGALAASIKALVAITRVMASQTSMLGKAINGAVASSKSFIASLNGIQKAILATGIGAFIVLVGALIANWKELTSWTDAATTAQYNFAASLRETQYQIGQLKLKIAEFNQDEKQIEEQRLRVVEGWTDTDFAKKRLKDSQDLQKQSQEALATAEKQVQEAKAKAAEAVKAYENAYDDRELSAYREKLMDNAVGQAVAAEYILKQAKNTVQEADRAVANAEKNLKNVTVAAEKAAEAAKKSGKSGTADKELEQLKSKAKGVMDALEEAQLSSLEKAKANYDKEQSILDAALAKRLITQEDYERTSMLLEDRYRKERNDIIDADIKEANEKSAQELADRRLAAEKRKKIAEEELEFQETLRQKQGKSAGGSDLSVWDLDAIVERNNAEFEAAKALNDAKIALNMELMQSYEENSEEYQRLLRENALLAAETDNADFERKKKNTEAEKKLMQARAAAMKSTVESGQSLLKGLSVAMGENTKMGKGFAIANATIDTIQASIAGFKAGYNQWKDAGPMAWMAPVQGAINAAAALAAGFAQVQQIRNVDTSGTNAGGGGGTAMALAIPNIEGLNSPIDYTRQVTTETEKEELNNRDNRVYILESDIQESNRRVKVREEETSF